ncbi:hypothetical protein C1645_733427 [Glomus cerebriforme]|uniref:Uncharacterized protein n=1 Tax=Glomus cerebriforme TaxID=658196 RepID=A0A397TID9_9GLOM|nr:hypothetical protein C1645_733427 [Glomus cerebriforme]
MADKVILMCISVNYQLHAKSAGRRLQQGDQTSKLPHNIYYYSYQQKSVNITAQIRRFKVFLQPVLPEMTPSPSVFPSEAELSSPSVSSSVAELSPPSVSLSEMELSLSLLLSNALQPKTPPQTHRELAHLLNTPNKWPIEKKELWQNPAIWNPTLERYIDTTLKESEDKFKDVIRNKDIIDIDEPFRLYYIDWIESHSRSAKILKSESNSGIILVDAKATRIFDGLNIWHLEVTGPPCNATDKHVLGDSKKTFQTDLKSNFDIARTP